MFDPSSARTFLLLFLLFDLLLLKLLALTVPPYRPLDQKDDHKDSHLLFPIITTSPSISPSTFLRLHPNLTALQAPVCHFLPSTRRLSSSKCAFLADQVCSDLVFQGPEALNRWIWADISGCALGYYLPDGAAAPTSLYSCDDLIFDNIRLECAEGGGGGGYNAGSINVDELPGDRGDGTAKVDGMGRWMMAPERLTG